MSDVYMSPLSERYSSKEMQYIFSPDKKFKTWRRLWIALAETEKELGLTQITDEMMASLKKEAFFLPDSVKLFFLPSPNNIP